MMYVPVYEKETTDKGKGVFASEFIPKGTLIWKLSETKKYTKEEWEKLPEVIKKDAYPDSDGNFVVATGKGESWNHSCDANTWWTSDNELSARRDIQKDEEITYDYATTDIDEAKGTNTVYDWKCKCGAKICRKILHWNDILKSEIYNMHKGHLPSWVEKFVESNLFVIKNIVAVIIQNNEGKILILKRSNDKKINANIWNLPSGGIEKNEDLLEAGKREVYEETGIRVKNLRSGISISVKINDNLQLKVNYLFAITSSSKVVLNDENVEYKWVKPEESIKYDFGISKKEVEKILSFFELI